MNGGITFEELGTVAGLWLLSMIVVGIIQTVIEWIKERRNRK